MKKILKILVLIFSCAVIAYVSYSLFVSIRINTIINSAANLEEYNKNIACYISESDYCNLLPRSSSKVYSSPKEKVKPNTHFSLILPFLNSSMRNEYGYTVEETNGVVFEEIESSIVTIDIDYGQIPFRINKVQLWNNGV